MLCSCDKTVIGWKTRYLLCIYCPGGGEFRGKHLCCILDVTLPQCSYIFIIPHLHPITCTNYQVKLKWPQLQEACTERLRSTYCMLCALNTCDLPVVCRVHWTLSIYLLYVMCIERVRSTCCMPCALNTCDLPVVCHVHWTLAIYLLYAVCIERLQSSCFPIRFCIKDQGWWLCHL